MGVHLRQRDNNVFIKSVNWTEGEVKFTDDSNEAKSYLNDWFANAEMKQLQHYASMSYEDGGLKIDKEHSDVIPNLIVYFT